MNSVPYNLHILYGYIPNNIHYIQYKESKITSRKHRRRTEEQKLGKRDRVSEWARKRVKSGQEEDVWHSLLLLYYSLFLLLLTRLIENFIFLAVAFIYRDTQVALNWYISIHIHLVYCSLILSFPFCSSQKKLHRKENLVFIFFFRSLLFFT